MTSDTMQKVQTQRYFKRFTLNQRLQHVVLMICMATLIITGMPVFYSEIPAARIMVQWMGGIGLRGALHRAAAVVLIALGCYHLLYVLFAERGRKEFLALMPARKDLDDMKGLLRYYFTGCTEKPQFGRFSFIEKFEYLAVGWGIVVMGTTGLMLWFPEKTMMLFPKWVIDIARVIHSYEALLAFLSIIIWHFYNVHLGPGSFPMSVTWLNGLISEERLREEHPAEYLLVAKEPKAWLTIPVLPSRRLVREEDVPASSRMKNGILAAGIGAGLGGIVPVFLLPLFGLTMWLLNPSEAPWGPALLALSIILLPSCMAGAVMGTYMGLSGYSLSYCLIVSFSSLLGFYLAPLSIWVPLASVIYVLQWFVPIGKFANVVFVGLMIASFFVGLIGSIIGAGRGKAWSQANGNGVQPLDAESFNAAVCDRKL